MGRAREYLQMGQSMDEDLRTKWVLILPKICVGMKGNR